MDIIEQLKKASVPSSLLTAAVQETVPEQFAKKFEELKGSIVDNDNRVILIHGLDSPFKDQFCAAFLKWYMVLKNKTGRWVSSSGLFDESVGNAGITVFPATYLYTPLVAKQLSNIIREKLPMGRAFVLCSTDKKSFDTVFGADFMAFISHTAVSVEVSVPRSSVRTI